MFADTPVVSVAVLWSGIVDDIEEVQNLIGNSLFKSSNWTLHLKEEAEHVARMHNSQATDAVQKPNDRYFEEATETVWRQTDNSSLMEGLYIKVENDGKVQNRIKLVRPDFISAIVDSGSHWADRNIVCNRIRPDVNLWR
jgi:hypothetical protein